MKGYETSITAPTTIREGSIETAPATGAARRRAWQHLFVCAHHECIVLSLCLQFLVLFIHEVSKRFVT